MSKQKPILVLDLEIYVDYFLAAFRNIETGNVRCFELFDGQALDVDVIRKILKKNTIVTFNGINFDIPILSMALAGAENALLKQACDAIIQNNLRSYALEKRFNFRILADVDHIDLIEVAPGMVSLKIYGGRLHCPKMQDLPIEPSASILPEQRASLREYCGNDLLVTETLYRKLLPQLELREKMSVEYGMDLRSKSDAQIAETVIKSEVERLTFEPVERPEIEAGTEYTYCAPSYIQFIDPVLRGILTRVQTDAFTVTGSGKVNEPDWLKNLKVVIGASTYRMGIGGLHSMEASVSHHADADTVLLERDVASYYPNIILSLGLEPRHMGEAFTRVYRSIVERRLAAKHSGDKVTADTLKICVNGSFGKLGSKWSVLFAPDLLIRTTVTGQLALLQLIEQLELSGIPVVSANTDGIVIKCKKTDVALMDAIVWGWECITGFDTEQTDYAALYSRDVNGYIAVKTNGKTKCKGPYASVSLSKSPASDVCVEAVVTFVKDGTPVDAYIRSCQDIRQFVTIRTVKGGALDQQGAYVGKAVRWYYSTASAGPLTYKVNNYTVPRSEGARTLMELPDSIPADLDYDWYVDEARAILVDIGAVAARGSLL
jgi:hypothetical protein